MSYRGLLRNLAGEDRFEPLYTVEMIRKWKLEKIKAIINQRKK